MNAPSEDIKDLLNDDSDLGLTFGTDLFVSDMPDTPDACVCIYDSGGYDPDVHIQYERPTVQVRIRGGRGPGAYQAAHEQAQEIRDFLIGLWAGGAAAMTVNGARYVGIWCVGDVNALGYDENHRPEMTVNFRLHRTAAS